MTETLTTLGERVPYALLPSPSVDYACLAVATGWERPDEYLHRLMQEPAVLGSTAGVLLDLLLANGTRTRRFFRIGRGTPMRAERVEPCVAVRQACNQHLKTHAAQVDLALLSPAMRYAVREGLLD